MGQQQSSAVDLRPASIVPPPSSSTYSSILTSTHLQPHLDGSLPRDTSHPPAAPAAHMSIQVYIGHTGQRLTLDPSGTSTVETLRAWITQHRRMRVVGSTGGMRLLPGRVWLIGLVWGWRYKLCSS